MGIAVSTVVSTLLAFGLLTQGPTYWKWVMPICGGGAFLAFLGWLDDCYSLRSSVRFAAHFLAAGWAVYWLMPPDSPLYLKTVATIGIVWAVNFCFPDNHIIRPGFPRLCIRMSFDRFGVRLEGWLRNLGDPSFPVLVRRIVHLVPPDPQPGAFLGGPPFASFPLFQAFPSFPSFRVFGSPCTVAQFLGKQCGRFHPNALVLSHLFLQQANL